MKKIALLLLASAAFMTSCSDDSNSDNNTVTDADYFPLSTGNYWTYDVTGAVSGRDSLYIAGDTVINSKIYKKFKTPAVPFGSVSSSLANNGLRKENGKLLVSGSTGFELVEGIPFNVTLTDFVVFKENAADNEELASISGTLQQQFGEYPLTFTYTLKTTAVTTLPTYTVDGTVYTNVKSVKTILNLKIGAVFSGVTIPVMTSQDVVTSTQYYAKDKGIVHATTTIGYQIDQTIALGLGIPQTYSQSQQESVDIYHLAE